MKKSLTSFTRYFLRSSIVFLLSSPFVILLLTLQTRPTIPENRPLTAREVSIVENLILSIAPESLSEPSLEDASLNTSDINLLIRHSLRMSGLSNKWNARVSTEERKIESTIDWGPLSEWMALYVTVKGSFLHRNGRLYLDQLSIGKLQIPKSWTAQLVKIIETNTLNLSTTFESIEQILKKVTIKSVADSEFQIQVIWEPELISELSDQAQRLFISSEDQERIIRHYLVINDLVTTISTDTRAISMSELLAPTFEAAYENSMAGADPQAENRTLFQTLAVYVNNEDISKLLGRDTAAELPRARFIEVRLRRRQDLAQHVASIAAITASLGPELAVLLSTTNETYDARYRSGFSFSDLTANSVGVTLASLAMQNKTSAIEMQRRLSELEAESDFMPEVGNNRDGISESAFNSIYADSSSSEYLERLNEIRETIEAKPIFQGF